MGGKGTHQVMRNKNSVKTNGCVEGGGQGYATSNENCMEEWGVDRG